MGYIEYIEYNFSPAMESLVIQGKKLCFVSCKKRGDVGDFLGIVSWNYRICHIHHCLLYSAVESYYDAIGFESPGQMETYLENEYGPLDYLQTVYLHFFAFYPGLSI